MEPCPGSGTASTMDEMPAPFVHASTSRTPRDVLARVFGHADFREHQEGVVSAILAGRDTLVVLPTGGGKSLCYQLPAVLLDGLTVVVTPLIALMRDQVEGLDRRGIRATMLHHHLEPSEVTDRLEAIAAGQYRLVYVSPERFRHPGSLEAMARAGVALLAIDEAHCLSTWGHDFRPDYQRLGEVRERLGRPPVVAVTATATPAVREDIRSVLDLRDPFEVVAGFDRPELRWVVRSTPTREAKRAKLQEIVAKIRGAGIVYVATRKQADRVLQDLSATGERVACYHAGMPPADREASQASWMRGESRIIVATNAFGMGVDRAGVRFVIHHDLPASLEGYYQEAGRAGRDRGASYAVLLYTPADRHLQAFMLSGSTPDLTLLWDLHAWLAGQGEVPRDAAWMASSLGRKVSVGAVEGALQVLERAGAIASGTTVRVTRQGRSLAELGIETSVWVQRRQRDLERLDRMVAFAEATTCRKALILGYFGEMHAGDCGACDVCLEGRTVTGDASGTEPALGRLARIRDRIAADLELPAYCVAHDRLLVSLAARPPRSFEDLLKVRGMSPERARWWAPHLVEGPVPALEA